MTAINWMRQRGGYLVAGRGWGGDSSDSRYLRDGRGFKGAEINDAVCLSIAPGCLGREREGSIDGAAEGLGTRLKSKSSD